MALADLAKQLQSLVAGALPLATTKIQILPFISAQITDDLWPITTVLAIVSSGITFNLGQQSQQSKLASRLALIGLAVAIVCVLLLVGLVGHLLFAESPEQQDAAARAAFILVFVGIGASLGWIATCAI